MTDFERENAERQTYGYGQNLEGRRPEQIEREIEQTRERMTRDIDALGERLNPRNLAHEAMDSVGERARRTGSRLVDFVRDNPLPIAAVGLGAVWLMRQRSQSTVSGDRMARYAYTGPERRIDNRGIKSRISHLVGNASTTVGDAVSNARGAVGEAVSGAASTVAQRASDFSSGAKSRMQSLGSSARDTATENPLAVAAGALVLGMLVGLLVPETDRENQMMGATRDRLADRAGDTAHRVVDATVDAADRFKDSVTNELNDRVPQVKEMAQDVARRVVDQAKDAAGRVKDEVKNG